jgi:ATP-dependent exoDNAse (exonuclease V) beta subunit
MHLKIISAGAGSGKTYRLTSEMVALLSSGEVRASGIIATTFTNKAAAELQERVRVRLLEEGLAKEANDLTNALIGTVHGLGVKLLKRFAFEAGVSPQVDIIADEDQQLMFNQSLATVLTQERVEEMEYLASCLGLNKSDQYKTDWRNVLKDLTEISRANDFSAAVLEESKQRSIDSFFVFLNEIETPEDLDFQAIDWNARLVELLSETVTALENNGDATKVTADGVKSLKELRNELNLRGELFWHQWVKISKTKVGAKSKDDLQNLAAFANCHVRHPAFREDIRRFISNLFDISQDALQEYERYKKSRGLIDYTDMEVLVRRLLDQAAVQAVLAEELDLLMVDEFQDTSPMQLEIFLKLSRFARHSIWVGDPKQSIYGFRGAEPALMEAIVKSQGGLKKENILEHSWRSREDIVNASNAIFTKAFSNMPPEQVALLPKRMKKAGPQSANLQDEPPEMKNALLHWHFKYDGEGRQPGKEWLNNCIASKLKTYLDGGVTIQPKGEKGYRQAFPGDVAILCRSNSDCQAMAEALHRAGLRAAISRAGLLSTAEAKLILACLKFILNKYDSLSIAEILLLAGNLSIEEIIENRLDYLDQLETATPDVKWGEGHPFIRRLNALRPQVVELSGSEILTLLLDELDLRRIIISWGKIEQRLSNIDVLTSLALKYEEGCNRNHSAASLGGFLLWLNDMENNGDDLQGSGESPLAVNIITYHKSKGLEYPIVLAHSLENQLRGDIWGFTIVQEATEVDLGNLLGNRWLRYWVNPYADQFRNTPLEEKINTSPAKAAKLKEALQEEARLLYVGLTRARDYLVFPSREKPAIWLNRVYHEGREETAALDTAACQTIWEWQGSPMEIDTEVLHFPNDFPRETPLEEAVFALEPPVGRGQFLPKQLDLAGGGNAKIGKEINYFLGDTPTGLPERQALYKALCTFLLADNANYPLKLRQEIVANLSKTNDSPAFWTPETFIACSDSFWNCLRHGFRFTDAQRYFPIRIEHRGQTLNLLADLLLTDEKTAIVILNTSFFGDAKARAKRARDYGAHLKLLETTTRILTGKSEVQTWLHFVTNSTLAKLAID